MNLPGPLTTLRLTGPAMFTSVTALKNRIYGFRPGGEGFLPFGAALFNFANGMHIDGDTLYAGGEGLWMIDMPSGEISDIRAPELSDIDGIESDGSGGLVVSIVGGDVIHRRSDGELQVWTTDDLGSTNHYYDVANNQVIMPTGYDNRVIAFTINP